MAEQAELGFMKTYLNTISSQPVTYADDYQQAPKNWLRKVPVLPVRVMNVHNLWKLILWNDPVGPSPSTSRAEISNRNCLIWYVPILNSRYQSLLIHTASISVTFKSLKPPAAYTISVHPTDTISSIKGQLAAEPTAPPADAQRLLLKGKALADGKLLQEYPVKEGDTVNLIVKPGFDWDPSRPASTVTPSGLQSLSPSPQLGTATSDDNEPSSGRRQTRGHQRIPSVVLSPSPSSTPGVVEKDIVLTLDSSVTQDMVQSEALSTFGNTISKPEFWERVYALLKYAASLFFFPFSSFVIELTVLVFCRSEFIVEGDALTAFENFFRASKGALTPSQIAKIRDQVGIVGMAGT